MTERAGAAWLARRLALGVLVVFGAATVAFAAFHLVPGDPVRVLLGGQTPTPDQLAEVRGRLGYDRPILAQYASFIGQLLRGDLGYSFQAQEPVSHLIGSQLPQTLELAAAALALALAASAALAVATAGRRPVLRGVSGLLELIAISTPGFWVGVLLLTFFSFRLRLFPAVGSQGVGSLVLPSVTLAIGLVGVFTQVLRAGIERALDEPFVLSSRARGTGQGAVRRRHALPHALVPLISLSGWTVGALLSGSVIIETIFSRQGLGRVVATAVAGRDLPVITGVTVVSAVGFTLVSVFVDWLSRVVDPRLREVAI
ncbi:peptide/nickel transport system permease protein [Catenulispora sp. MAP5-51]|uniref:ABC transporter permease n=1 Tax=Catenulispora sp. MAP5-51 TaxID=3156298 RepID=UPI003514CA85